MSIVNLFFKSKISKGKKIVFIDFELNCKYNSGDMPLINTFDSVFCSRSHNLTKATACFRFPMLDVITFKSSFTSII